MKSPASQTGLLFTLLFSLTLVALLLGEAVFKSSAQSQPQLQATRRQPRVSGKRATQPRKQAAPQKLSSQTPAPNATPAWDALVELAVGRGKTQASRTDQPGEAAEFFNFKRAPAGERELPVERYLAARAWMDEMPQYSAVEGRALPSRKALRTRPEQQLQGAWTFLGPGNVGGRTRVLVIHPTNPSTMYAAAISGGVWKSTDAGAS
jgi:hypothetical protein